MYSFCPFCGQKLPQAPLEFVFCPFCGNSLTGGSSAPVTVAETVSAQEEHIAAPLTKSQEKNSEFKHQVELCHLLLKDCNSPDLLKRRLTGILLRSPMAIQMAVDRLPSVLLYKSRIFDLPVIIEAFRETNSAIAVLDAAKEPDKPSLTEAITAAGLQQEWISSLPENLWQGEGKIELIARVLFDGEESLLLKGQSNLFIVDATSWKAKTMGFIEKILLQAENKMRIDEWTIEFLDAFSAAPIYARLKKETTKARNSWFFNLVCEKCNASQETNFHNISSKEQHCASCGGNCKISMFFAG